METLSITATFRAINVPAVATELVSIVGNCGSLNAPADVWEGVVVDAEMRSRGETPHCTREDRLREVMYAATPVVDWPHPQRAEVTGNTIGSVGGVTVSFDNRGFNGDAELSAHIDFGRDSVELSGDMVAALEACKFWHVGGVA